MPIKFPCPNPECLSHNESKKLTTRDDQVGRTLSCPACGTRITVPTKEILSWFQTQGIKFGVEKYGETLLHKAAKTGRVDVMIWLKKHGDEGIDTRDSTFLTPIYYAVSEGHVAAMKWLKEQNADFSANDRFESPVFSAARNGHIDALKYLHEVCQIPLDTIHPTGENSLIAFAAQGGQVGVMQWLVDCGATTAKVKDKDSQTLYFDAIRGGHIEVMDWLYQQKVNVNEPDKRRKTPIFTAVYLGNILAMQWLKDHNAKLNLTDENDETLMSWAEYGNTDGRWTDGHKAKVIKWLRDNDVVEKEKPARSSYENIFRAATSGTVEDVKYFIENENVYVNTQDSDGWTPLWFAAYYNDDVEVMKYLLSKKADVHVKAKNRLGWYEAQLLKQGDDISPEKMRILQKASGCLVFLAALGGLLISGVCGLAFFITTAWKL